MPDLADAVLLAATLAPAERTAESLSGDFGVDLNEVTAAVADLRTRGHLQKQRGNPKWSREDRLRPSKAGEAACRTTLRAAILHDAAEDEDA